MLICSSAWVFCGQVLLHAMQQGDAAHACIIYDRLADSAHQFMCALYHGVLSQAEDGVLG